MRALSPTDKRTADNLNRDFSCANSQAVLSKVKRMGWFWNTVLVIVTGGLWLIYVI